MPKHSLGSALLAWVTQTSEALHALRVPPSLFETLPGFFSDCLPFLKLAIDKRTEALQLLQNLNGRDATASAAAALLAADAQEGRDFSALEVDAFVAACETHQGAAAQQLEMLDAVAASSVARVRQGFVASADTQQSEPGVDASVGARCDRSAAGSAGIAVTVRCGCAHRA